MVCRRPSRRRIEGVFLGDRPLDCNEGAKGDELLKSDYLTSWIFRTMRLSKTRSRTENGVYLAELIKQHGEAAARLAIHEQNL